MFFDAGEKEYELGNPLRNSKKWQETEAYYIRSLEYKKSAYHLNPTKEYLEEVYTHKRLLAQLLIDADIEEHKPEASNIADITKAINLLKECNPQNQEEQNYHKYALANGLMRRVDTLREKIAFRTTSDRVTLKEHKKETRTRIVCIG